LLTSEEVSMLKRIANLFKGFIGLFVSNVERQNPQALIEVEKENLRTQIARFNDNLATHAGFIERLMRQVKNLEQKEKELTAKVAAHIKAGNRAVAGQLALELGTVKEQLEENRQQIVAAEETYKKLIKSRDVAVQEARAKIEKLSRLISETEMMEAQAELQTMASGMIDSIGGSGDTLNRVEEYLNERRDKAAGKARVASSSIDVKDVELKEAEQAALGEQALREFETAYGFASPAQEETPGAQAPQKELGPKEG
jgi:phage shock protein A